MNSFDRMSLKRWMAPVAAALALAGLLAALSTAVISGFSDGQAPEVIHRTARPFTTTRTPTITLTPSMTLTPSETPTPTFTLTPSQTPTPFPTKDITEIGNTVMIGGSTGDETIDPFSNFNHFVPMFDGKVGSSFDEVAHVTLPGAITHLTVKLDRTASELLTFAIVSGSFSTVVQCFIPAKGKGDFCEAGDKGQCLEVRPQDRIAVLAAPAGGGGQPAGIGNGTTPYRMSWVAKLELYGECPDN